VSYAARIGTDDRLIAIEQRLTREYLDQLKTGVSRESDVRDVLGPPYRIDPFPRMQRDAWTYQAQGIQPQLIIVQFSQDHILREAYMIEDPEYVQQQSSD
jgi:outer membrane protein assembly factor BamE (lipoprotein component of BamABCDE complex)